MAHFEFTLNRRLCSFSKLETLLLRSMHFSELQKIAATLLSGEDFEAYSRRPIAAMDANDIRFGDVLYAYAAVVSVPFAEHLKIMSVIQKKLNACLPALWDDGAPVDDDDSSDYAFSGEDDISSGSDLEVQDKYDPVNPEENIHIPSNIILVGGSKSGKNRMAQKLVTSLKFTDVHVVKDEMFDSSNFRSIFSGDNVRSFATPEDIDAAVDDILNLPPPVAGARRCLILRAELTASLAFKLRKARHFGLTVIVIAYQYPHRGVVGFFRYIGLMGRSNSEIMNDAARSNRLFPNVDALKTEMAIMTNNHLSKCLFTDFEAYTTFVIQSDENSQ